ncbi:hypothetical protein [Candidatus Burkholderia verschuerenii]|uniref:hypothetical protein n=1 Tax=Candidatus Burkholderia verschuerenii TaxID=242163 RepID=UPI0012EECB82|nr:hypothetical protein [Candidatus Burkholderia verschuerenii]
MLMFGGVRLRLEKCAPDHTIGRCRLFVNYLIKLIKNANIDTLSRRIGRNRQAVRHNGTAAREPEREVAKKEAHRLATSEAV